MMKWFFKRLHKAVWVGAGALMLAGGASAAIQQHTFSITGNNGETGTGTFTWDDAVVANGNALIFGVNVLTVNISVSGGNVVGGATSFALADCTDAILDNTPNFGFDINFWCSNATNSLFGVAPYSNVLNQNGTSSTLTFAPVSTSSAVVKSVPTLSEWAMILTASLMALGTFVVMRRRG